MAFKIFLLLAVAFPAWAAEVAGVKVDDKAKVGNAEEAKEGMLIALDWNGRQTQVLIDSKPAGSPIEGEEFYRALLRIWLGDAPVQDDLKRALLGG